MTQRTARCLCGEVTLSVSSNNNEMSVCHCRTCRQWGGGPLMAVHCGTNVGISHEENVTLYNSSDWAERAFCNSCGTHLFYRLKGVNEHIIPAGLFEQQDFHFSEQIFIDKKPSFYEFSNQTDCLTEQQVFEKYAP